LANPEQETRHCPHCGRELSPWEQVLLNVDRALMCKGCWYRIILDAFDLPRQDPLPGSPQADSKENADSA